MENLKQPKEKGPFIEVFRDEKTWTQGNENSPNDHHRIIAGHPYDAPTATDTEAHMREHMAVTNDINGKQFPLARNRIHETPPG